MKITKKTKYIEPSVTEVLDSMEKLRKAVKYSKKASRNLEHRMYSYKRAIRACQNSHRNRYQQYNVESGHLQQSSDLITDSLPVMIMASTHAPKPPVNPPELPIPGKIRKPGKRRKKRKGNK